MLRLLEWLVRRLPVYRKGHLLHADGSLYMGQWRLFETSWLSARLHLIATPDYDRHLHDHPWVFWSLVLSGGYVEERPISVEPCFQVCAPARGLVWEDDQREKTRARARWAGALCFRRATDRHRITAVMPGTYTLFVYFRKRQWWGFYTPQGKVHWKAYESVHAAVGREITGGE
jgi:hypothetical protein